MQHFSHHYQSDISRQQFDLIRQDLEASRSQFPPHSKRSERSPRSHLTAPPVGRC